jgi:lipoprotein-anchoring transpeptidase ErfK/SrfK
MLKRQHDHNELLRRSFMLMSFAAAILMITLRGHTSAGIVTTGALPEPGISSLPAEDAVRAERQNSASRATRDSHRAHSNRIARTRLEVDLSDRQVSFYQNGEVVAQYPVAIGQTGWETPTGTFQVTEMHVDPEWQHPITGEIVPAGTANPLGSRWIGFWSDGINQIGFHGTNEADSIGQAISHGCVRMWNPDIEALYDQIEVGMTVAVVP